MSNVPSLFSNAPIGFGPGGPLPAPSPWTSYGNYIFYGNGGVVVGSPSGGNLGVGSINAASIAINGIVINPGNFLASAGGTISGDLIVGGNLTVDGAVDGIVLDMGTF